MLPFTPLEQAFSNPPTTRRMERFPISFSSPLSGPFRWLPSIASFSSLESCLPWRIFCAPLRPLRRPSAFSAPGSNESTAPTPAPLTASLRLPPLARAVAAPVRAPIPACARGPILRNGSAPVSAPVPAASSTCFKSLPALTAWIAPMAPPTMLFTTTPPGMKVAARERPVTSSCPAGLCTKPAVAW